MEVEPYIIETAYGYIYVGEAIVEVLEFLENKFGLDFNELAKQK